VIFKIGERHVRIFSSQNFCRPISFRSPASQTSDRRRHKHKIEKAIREGIHDIVADESIIGQDGKKKFRIPVRGIKEYRFIYGSGEENKNVGSAPGRDVKRGQVVRQKSKSKKPGEGKAGNEKGEEFYEVEISLDELARYLFDELELPDMERKAVPKR
jgi:uncharacterized sporulation protein YeaH/YhbH (DUF444 family)